tara:strand:+ start:1751 stop:3058 length:1308 start_codon:yes stop_codon:yes gene_type:complete
MLVDKDYKRAHDLVKQILEIGHRFLKSDEYGTDYYSFQRLFKNSFYYFSEIDKIGLDQSSEPFFQENIHVINNFFKENRELSERFIFLINNVQIKDYKWATYIPWHLVAVGEPIVKKTIWPDKNFIPYGDSYVEELKTHKRKKYFVWYNGGCKPLRLYLVNELRRLGVEDKGIISMLGFSYYSGSFNHLKGEDFFRGYPGMDEYPYEIDEDWLETHNWIPDRIPIDESADPNVFCPGSGDAQKYYNISHIEDTYFSIVSETTPMYTVEQGSRYISEKTSKHGISVSPFIVHGERGVLKELRRLGFETFPEWFDESYDEMEAGIEKILFLAKQINNICLKPLNEIHELYVKTLPKVIYNQKHLIDFYKKWEKELIIETSEYNPHGHHFPKSTGTKNILIEIKTSGVNEGNMSYIINKDYRIDTIYESDPPKFTIKR